MIGRSVVRQAVIVLGSMVAVACGAPVPETVGLTEGGLYPCPSPSNCVRSQDSEGTPRLQLRPGPEPSEVWAEVVEVVSAMPRTRVLRQTDRYIHAEVTSWLFRFRDDLELLLEHDSNSIQLRSASRVGRSDMGVNGERVDRLVALLVASGLVVPPADP